MPEIEECRGRDCELLREMAKTADSTVREHLSIIREMAQGNLKLLLALLALSGGSSYSEVAAQFGVTKRAVMKWVRRYSRTHPALVRGLLGGHRRRIG